MNPAVTVLMPVYNGAVYLRQSIESILSQSFSSFEFLIVDDCSNDDSAAIAASYPDKRMRVVRSPNRLGICGALNLGLSQSLGKYVARMDADDISRPDRLEKQVLLMKGNDRLGFCGSWALRFGEGQGRFVQKMPTGHENIRAHLLFDNPIVHSSVMLRRSVLERHSLRYREEFRNAEDYDLWTRMIEHCRADNIPDTLLEYRVHSASVTLEASGRMDAQACKILKLLFANLGVDLSDDELLFHRYISTNRLPAGWNRKLFEKAEHWLRHLLEENDRAGRYERNAFKQAVAAVWFSVCYLSLASGWPVIWRHVFSDLGGLGDSLILAGALVKRTGKED